MRNHSAETVGGHRKVLSGFLKPDSLGLIHIILNNKREASSEPKLLIFFRVETNTHIHTTVKVVYRECAGIPEVLTAVE